MWSHVILAMAVISGTVVVDVTSHTRVKTGLNSVAGAGSTETVSLIAEEEQICPKEQCGLCNPCEPECCGSGQKPLCCAQQQNPVFKIPYVAPYNVRDTPCPSCSLCKSIMAQSYVDPKLAECCNARPCGTKKTISNKIPEPPQNQTVVGKNPYGANWTYEKHVKKNGINTVQFENASALVKAAVAYAASYDPPLQKNKSNISTSRNESEGNLIVLPPGVDAKDWSQPPANSSELSTASDRTMMTSLGESESADLTNWDNLQQITELQ